MKRRNFVQNVGLTAAGTLFFPSIVPSTVYGKNAPSNRINVGLIGVGRQCYNTNMPQFLAHEDCQIVAVCDVDSWRLTQAAKKVNDYYSAKSGKPFNGCKTYRDFRELLKQKDIDAVMISTPDHWHATIGVLAAQAGKHVSIEKPLTNCIASGRVLADAIKKAGVINRTDSEFRSLRPYNKLVEIAKNGYLGKIQNIYTTAPFDNSSATGKNNLAKFDGNIMSAQNDMPVPEELDYDMWLGPAFWSPYTETRAHKRFDTGARPGWIRISEYCNGMISNWGTHLNDLAQWANDSEYSGPVEVEGTGEFTKGLWNTVATFDVKYKYANGVNLFYKTGPVATIKIEGSNGWMQVEYPNKVTASSPVLLDAKVEKGMVDFSGNKEDKRDFLDAIKNKTATMEPVEVGHRTVSVCQMGLIAILQGIKLTWDPAKEEFLNNNAANAMKRVPMRSPWNILG